MRKNKRAVTTVTSRINIINQRKNNMIRVKLYQNKYEKNETAYNKWYPRVIVEETIGLEELSAHMASHNAPFSKGAIKGPFYKKGRGMILRYSADSCVIFTEKGRGMICNKDKSIVIRIKKEGQVEIMKRG